MATEGNTVESTAVTVVERGGVPALPQEMSIEQVVQRVNKMHEIQARVMRQDVHYGVIPGTPKPTLLKAGAEILCMTFMLDPEYEHTITQNGDHREIVSRCILHHIPSGNRVGSGEGMCSTRESKYAYRKGSSECPSCGMELRKSKNKPEWYCWAKQGGCGSTYPLNDTGIKVGGRMANPDLADQYNTVLKMANKRALVAAILNATAASEIFTQDIGDDEDGSDGDEGAPGKASRQASGANGDKKPPSPAPAAPPPIKSAVGTTDRASDTGTRTGQGKAQPPSKVGSTPTPDKESGERPPLPGPAAGAEERHSPQNAGAAPPSAKPSGVPRMTDGQIKLVWARARQTGLVKGNDCSGLMTVLNSFGVAEPQIAGKTQEEICAAMIAAIPPVRLTQIVGAFGKPVPALADDSVTV